LFSFKGQLRTADSENESEASININVLRDLSVASVYFIVPQNNTSAAAGSNVELRGFAYDPSGISAITFAVVNPDSTTSVVATAAPGADSTAAVVWPVPSTPGTYRLSLNAERGSGPALHSDFLTVLVR